MPDNSAKALLTLERQDELIFSGRSIRFDTPVIFGGQLLAQSLYAAANTLPRGCFANHLSAHFLNYGNPEVDLQFQVRVIKDGQSTNIRQVEVTQAGRLLMLSMVSFAQTSAGYEFFSAMPDVPQADTLTDDNSIRFGLTADQSAFPFSMVGCPDDIGHDVNTSSIWVRALIDTDHNRLWQQMLFAFVSDATVLQSALRPHRLNFGDPGLTVATMNHTLWFHRMPEIEDWMLIHSNSPSTGSGRGLSVASAFNGGGELQCTVAQEGVLKRGSA